MYHSSCNLAQYYCADWICHRRNHMDLDFLLWVSFCPPFSFFWLKKIVTIYCNCATPKHPKLVCQDFNGDGVVPIKWAYLLRYFLRLARKWGWLQSSSFLLFIYVVQILFLIISGCFLKMNKWNFTIEIAVGWDCSFIRHRPDTAGTQPPDRSCWIPPRWIPFHPCLKLKRRKRISIEFFVRGKKNFMVQYHHSITLFCKPMEKGFTMEHDWKLFLNAFENLLNGRWISDKSGCHFEIFGRNIAYSRLDVVRNPFHEMAEEEEKYGSHINLQLVRISVKKA